MKLGKGISVGIIGQGGFGLDLALALAETKCTNKMQVVQLPEDEAPRGIILNELQKLDTKLTKINDDLLKITEFTPPQTRAERRKEERLAKKRK